MEHRADFGPLCAVCVSECAGVIAHSHPSLGLGRGPSPCCLSRRPAESVVLSLCGCFPRWAVSTESHCSGGWRDGLAVRSTYCSCRRLEVQFPACTWHSQRPGDPVPSSVLMHPPHTHTHKHIHTFRIKSKFSHEVTILDHQFMALNIHSGVQTWAAPSP